MSKASKTKTHASKFNVGDSVTFTIVYYSLRNGGTEVTAAQKGKITGINGAKADVDYKRGRGKLKTAVIPIARLRQAGQQTAIDEWLEGLAVPCKS